MHSINSIYNIYIYIPFQTRRPLVGGLTIRAGMYYIFLNDWFQVFPRSHFHIIQADKYYRDIPRTLKKVFNFLGVRSLSRSELDLLKEVTIRKSRKGPSMLSKTQVLLDEFYRPHNNKLAKLLNDKSFTWA
jgi:N-acetylgalactosamine 4-sulfate 6-O-sulfotransferase